MDDLGALKVADLKIELKNRGLSTVGSKAELQQRLIEALTLPPPASDQQMTTSAVSGSMLVGISETSLLPEIPTEEEEALLGSADEAALLDGPDDNSLLDAPVVGFAKQTCIGGDESKPPKTIKLQKPKISDDFIATATNAIGQSVHHVVTSAAETKTNLAAEPTTSDVLEKRRLKFGNAVSPDQRKAKRAERFNTAAAEAKPSKLAGTDVAVDLDTLKKRANRFGTSAASLTLPADQTNSSISIGQGDEVLQKRAARFGLKNAKASTKICQEPAESIEVLSKRAARFGTSLNDKSQSTSVPPSVEVLKKRAARFNVENETVKKAKRMEKFGAPMSA